MDRTGGFRFCALLVVLGSLAVRSDAASRPLRIGEAPSSSAPLPFIVLHGDVLFRSGPTHPGEDDEEQVVLTYSLHATATVLFSSMNSIGDACVNPGLRTFTSLLEEMTGATGFCIEIGNGMVDSFFMRLDKQADVVCQQVRNISELQHGYNMVGLSQGNVIGRAVIEWCDDAPPVNNFISIGGPHAGIAAVPLCKVLFVCKLVDAVIRIGVYSSYVQNNLAPTGYVKIPTDLDAYYSGCLFLPRLNNELPESRNATYKERFSSLNHLVLIAFDKDEVLFPSNTAWFGFYAPNDFKTLLDAEETDLYKEDWIGLKALDDAKRVSYVTFAGSHLLFSEDEMLESIVPYLLPTFPSSVVAM